MINLQSNYPVLREQEIAWKALMLEAVERFSGDSIGLPAFGGSRHNRELAAAYLELPAHRVLIAEAGHHALMAALLAAKLQGKTIAVEELTYPWFVLQTQSLGARVAPVAMDDECMRPEALRALCESEPVHALYSMPSLHNPTCATAGLERRRAIVDIAREFNLSILEDGAYGFLLATEPARYYQLAPERSFYIESLSKRVAPGLRTAFLVAPASLSADAELALRIIASGSSTLLASLGCVMVADGRAAAAVTAKRVEGEARRQHALRVLKGLESVSAPNSWHVWVELPPGCGDDADVERRCEQLGVLVTGARWFAAPGTPARRAVRLGLGGEVDRERALEGLEIFVRAVSG